MRIKGLKSTNPVAVGDEVRFTIPEPEEKGVIQEILPRKNYLLRRAIAHAHKVHILAANIDQAILLFTIDHPETSAGFADRFLVVAEAYHIPAKVLINKIDTIQTDTQKERLATISTTYEQAGYEVLHVNALDEFYKPQVAALLTDKVTFIGGHSGSGKSTLINMIDPKLNIKTAQISDYSNKGKHTTTFAEMHPLATGGYIIDSPGIKELGITDFERNEVSHYFPEMRSRLTQCRFNNCTHTSEPHCEIKKSVAENTISRSRYESYLRILQDIEDNPRF
ncbi:UNVERIFIED_CONTAM: hypothetical protein GTU68_038743 [Idotea baltica]|nr:hypothetical protein [Idotea baltica]